jgi:hypothetical protein
MVTSYDAGFLDGGSWILLVLWILTGIASGFEKPKPGAPAPPPPPPRPPAPPRDRFAEGIIAGYLLRRLFRR